MGPRLLIVDDSRSVRETLAASLETVGYEVLTAASGEEAFEHLRSSPIDLALLDLRLPEMSGIEILQFINNESPDTRVIIITGHGSLDTAIEALRAGAIDYLIKPIDVDQVFLSIRRALSDKENLSRKKILIEQLLNSVDQLKDIEGIRREELPARRVVSLPTGLLVDFERREIWRGDERVHLTPSESKLLSIFVENRGQVLGHRDLVFLLQGLDVSEMEAPEILRPMVSRLRKKMAVFHGLDSWVSNIRGTGYLFDPS